MLAGLTVPKRDAYSRPRKARPRPAQNIREEMSRGAPERPCPPRLPGRRQPHTNPAPFGYTSVKSAFAAAVSNAIQTT